MEVVVEGNCYISGRFERCCIGIDGGKVVRIAKILEGDRTYRFGSKMILPGATDAHVHFREPGLTNKEDFATGSLAAVHGGVTCVLDMPNTVPPTVSVEALQEKRRLASAKSHVDFGLFAGVTPGVDVAALAKEAVAFKLYMAGTTGDLVVPSPDQVAEELRAIAATGKVLAVHAEDERLRKKDVEADLEQHLRSRNNDCETSAIRRIKEAASECRLHICHVSAKESVPLVVGAAGVTCEVTPHHLLFDKDSKLGSSGKVNPPLRKREDRFALFQALKEGAFDAIVSDHAPHTAEEKDEDFDYAPSGMPGVETLLPLILQLVRDGHLRIDLAVKKLCERPADLYGLMKGRIAPGYDADLTVVDLDATRTIKADNLHSKCGWTAYEGMSGVFPSAVFLRGQLMVDGGGLVGERDGMDALRKAGSS